jgi:hypothetical protein
MEAHAVFDTISRTLADQVCISTKAGIVLCPLAEMLLFEFKSRKPATLFISSACAIASSQVRDG